MVEITCLLPPSLSCYTSQEFWSPVVVTGPHFWAQPGYDAESCAQGHKARPHSRETGCGVCDLSHCITRLLTSNWVCSLLDLRAFLTPEEPQVSWSLSFNKYDNGYHWSWDFRLPGLVLSMLLAQPHSNLTTNLQESHSCQSPQPVSSITEIQNSREWLKVA